MASSGNEPVAGARVEIGADEKKLEQGLDAAASVVHKFTQDANRQFGQMAARIQGYVDKIDATEATTRLGLLEQAVGKLGGVSNLTAPQLGRVQVELQKLADQGGRVPASLQAINKEADKLTASVKAAVSGGWSGVLSAISPQAVAAGAAVAALTGAVVKLGAEVLKQAAWAVHIQNAGISSGQTAERIQLLEYAAKRANVSVEAVVKGAEKLVQQLGEDAGAFRQLGLDVEHLKTLDPGELFDVVTRKVASLGTQHERAAAAAALFGKAGVENYLPLINQLGALEQQARATNVVLSDEQLAGLAKLDDKVGELSGAWEAFKRHLSAYIADSPALVDSIDVVTAAIAGLSGKLRELQDPGNQGWYTGLKVRFLELGADLLEVGAKVDKFWGSPQGMENARRQLAMAADLRQQIIEIGKAGDKGTAGPKEGGGAKFTPKGKVLIGGQVVDESDVKAMQSAGEAWLQRQVEEERKVAARNRDLDGKAAAEVGARARKQAEELSNQLLQIKVRELAIRKGITEDAARSQIDAERKGSEWLQERAKNDAGVIAKAEAVKAEAKRLGMSAIDAQISKIEEATAAALRHVEALELEGKIGPEAATKARDAYNEAADAEIRYAKQVEAIQKIGKVRDLFGELVGLLDELGVSADSNLGKAARAGEQLAGAMESGAKSAAAFTSGDYLTAAIEGLKTVRQLVSAFKTLFSEPSWKKVGREAGRVLGMEISEELAKQIEKTSKDLKISVEAASLLNLSKAIQDSRRDAREFAVQVGQLMAGIADGSIPAREGVQELSAVFTRMREEAEAAGIVGDAALVAVIKQAKALGQLTPEMEAFLDEQARVAEEGAKKIAAGMSQLTTGTVQGQDWAIRGADAADFFGYGFQQAIAERGLLGAIDEQGEGLDAFYEKMRLAGDETALALLQPFKDLRDQLGEEGDLRGALTTLEGMDQVFQAMANSGDLTAQRTAAMARSIEGTFNALQEGGVSTSAALQAIQPELRHLVSASQQYGFELDANTERLVQQSRGAGFAFPTEPMVQVVDLLRAIATQLGAAIPESARQSAKAFEDFGSSTSETFSRTVSDAERMAQDVSAGWDAGADAIALRADQMGGEIHEEITAMADAAETVFGYMTDDLQASLSGWAGIAEDATGEVKDMLAQLPSGISIPIDFPIHEPDPSQFPGGGEKGGGDGGLPQYAFGGIEDFGRESIVALHGREAIVPEGGGGWFMDMLRTAVLQAGGVSVSMPISLHVDGARDPRATGQAVVQAIRDQQGPLVTALREAVLGAR